MVLLGLAYYTDIKSGKYQVRCVSDQSVLANELEFQNIEKRVVKVDLIVEATE